MLNIIPNKIYKYTHSEDLLDVSLRYPIVHMYIEIEENESWVSKSKEIVERSLVILHVNGVVKSYGVFDNIAELMRMFILNEY